MDEKMNGTTEKVEIFNRGQSEPAFQKTTKQLFCQLLCDTNGTNISQIFSFTRTIEPHHIQLVPNI